MSMSMMLMMPLIQIRKQLTIAMQRTIFFSLISIVFFSVVQLRSTQIIIKKLIVEKSKLKWKYSIQLFLVHWITFFFHIPNRKFQSLHCIAMRNAWMCSYSHNSYIQTTKLWRGGTKKNNLFFLCGNNLVFRCFSASKLKLNCLWRIETL